VSSAPLATASIKSFLLISIRPYDWNACGCSVVSPQAAWRCSSFAIIRDEAAALEAEGAQKLRKQGSVKGENGRISPKMLGNPRVFALHKIKAPADHLIRGRPIYQSYKDGR
jgi:hypothetical protein